MPLVIKKVSETATNMKTEKPQHEATRLWTANGYSFCFWCYVVP